MSTRSYLLVEIAKYAFPYGIKIVFEFLNEVFVNTYALMSPMFVWLSVLFCSIPVLISSMFLLSSRMLNILGERFWIWWVYHNVLVRNMVCGLIVDNPIAWV